MPPTLPNQTPATTVPRRAAASERIVAGAVAGSLLALLIVSAWLTPDAEGAGTHTQLGLAPCPWPILLDKPCPTCGMTTSFALAAEGRLLSAAAVQPFGWLLAIGASTAFWVGLHVAATGSRAGRVFTGLLTPRALMLGGGGLAGAWLFKVLTW